MDKFVVIFVTVPSFEEGERIVSALVGEKLAACGNIISGLTSIYIWEEKVCKEEEHLLILKTRVEKVEELTGRVGELHSYDVPEIIALPIIYGSGDYLDWVKKSTE